MPQDHEAALDADRPGQTTTGLFEVSRKRLILACVGCFAVAAQLGFLQVDHAPRFVLLGNEAAHVGLLHSLANKQSFDVRLPFADRSYYQGHYYSNKPPGYAFFLLPSYALFVKATGDDSIRKAFFWAKLSNVLLSALASVCVLLFLATYEISAPWIALGTLAATAGTIFPAYSSLATSVPLSILLCFLALLLFRLWTKANTSTLLLAGTTLVVCYACIVDYANAFVLLPLSVWVALQAVKRRAVWPCVAAAALPTALLLFYNYQLFGTLLVNTYQHYQPPSYVPWSGVSKTMALGNMPHGLFGLLVSPGRGLFILSPVAALGVLGALAPASRRDMSLRLCLWMAVSGVLIGSAYHLWHGGHSVGYRHALPSAMLLCMLGAFANSWRSRIVNIVGPVILSLSMASGIAAFLVQTDQRLLGQTWKAEPADVHASYYPELVIPRACRLFELRCSAPKRH